jgi:PleD family two-component response regulator
MKNRQAEPTNVSTVLVVDDDPGARLLVGSALEIAGFRVVTAADGASALRQYPEQPIDCVVLDVVMPGMNGFDVCSALRSNPESCHVPVLMQTSLDDMESVRRAYTAGATDFSSKGINPMLLAERVKFLVRSKQTQDQLRESEAKVRYLAYYDPLTGLPNRQRLLQILEQQVAWAAPRQRGVAVLMLDINNFSRINDTQGQAVGDGLLQEVAHRLQHCLRDQRTLDADDTGSVKSEINDWLARTGGDEFALALPGIATADTAHVVARRVQQALSTPMQPCTTARRAAATRSSSSRSRSARVRRSICRWKRICARPSTAASSRSIISRACASRTCRWKRSKRCCAGGIRPAASCRRTNSFRSPNRPG